MVTLGLVSAAWGQHRISAEELRKITKILGTSPPLRIGKAISMGVFSDEVDSKHVNIPLENFGVRYNGNAPAAADKVLEEETEVFEFNFGRGAINGPVVSSDKGRSFISSLGRGTDDGPVVSIDSKKKFFKSKSPKFHSKSRKEFSKSGKNSQVKLNFGFKPIHGPKVIRPAVGGLLKGDSFSTVVTSSVTHHEEEAPVVITNSVDTVTTDDIETESASDKVDKDMDGKPDILYRSQIDKVLVSSAGAGPGTKAVRQLLDAIDAPVEEDLTIDSPVHDVNVIDDQTTTFSENEVSFSNTRRTRSHPITEPRKQLINQIRHRIVRGSHGSSSVRPRSINNNQQNTFSTQQNTLSSVADLPSMLKSASIVRGMPFKVISDRHAASNFADLNVQQHTNSHNQQRQLNNQNFNIRQNANSHSNFAPVRSSSVLSSQHANNQHQFVHNQAQSQASSPVRNQNSGQSQTNIQSHTQFNFQNTHSSPTSAHRGTQVQSRPPTVIKQTPSVPTHTPVHTSTHRFTQNSAKKQTTFKQAPLKPTHAPKKFSPSVKPVQVVQPRQKASAPSITALRRPSSPTGGASAASSFPASLLKSLGGAQGPSVLQAGAGGSQIIVKTIVLDASDADPSSDAFKKALEKATKEAREDLGVPEGEELGLFGGRRRKRELTEVEEEEESVRRRRQLFGGEGQSTAQALGGALSTGAGLFASD